MRDLLEKLRVPNALKPSKPSTHHHRLASLASPEAHSDNNDQDDDTMTFTADYLTMSQKRGVAGLCACVLPQVNDASMDLQWSQTFLKMLVQAFLKLPETQVEAFLPMLMAQERALEDEAASGDIVAVNESDQPNDRRDILDPTPFLSLLVVENGQDEAESTTEETTSSENPENQASDASIDPFQWKILQHMLWFTVKTIGYDARTRVLFRRLAEQMHIRWDLVTNEEIEIGRTLFAEATAMPMDKKVESKRNLWDWKRNVTIGAAAVTGGALLALTGGIAAPAIAASLTALGGAGAAVGTVVGSAAGVTATTVLFGTAGAGVVGMKADNRLRGVHQFNFDLVTSGDGMNVYICVAGWLDDDDPMQFGFRRSWGDSREYLRAFYRRYNPDKVDQVDQVLDRYKGREDEFFGILRKTYRIQHGSAEHDPLGMQSLVDQLEQDATEESENSIAKPSSNAEKQELLRAWRWKDRFPQGDQYCLNWEEDLLRKFGKSMRTFATQQVVAYANSELISYTAFAALFAAVSIPRTIMKLADLIDNTWVLAMNRADESGKILADALLRREQGLRPVTLVGYGMGARLIFACLKELATKDDAQSLGIVENVVLLGSPVPVDASEWKRVRRVVAGRLINGYSEHDWMLAIMYRYQGWALNSAGIGPIDIAGVENVNLSSIVHGHLEYKHKIGRILTQLQLEGGSCN